MKRFAIIAIVASLSFASQAEARCGRSKPVRKALAKMFEGRRGCSNQPSGKTGELNCRGGACQPSKNVGELPACASGQCRAK